jgi:pimeloyl-ACP methyl ester carboxylesterase
MNVTSTAAATTDIELPWLPPGRIARLEGRGEIFYRHHVHPDRAAETVLLLHGWTASADTQFFTAYEALATKYSIIAVDHRGHGRGIRAPFSLEAVADDVAELLRFLGETKVIVVGYSMGGPIAMHLTRRHSELVSGFVLEATALEWQSTRRDRLGWYGLGLVGVLFRSRWYLRTLQMELRRITKAQPDMQRWMPWMTREMLRNDPAGVLEAGRALSRHDARPWAASLTQPSAMLITTQDRVVPPAKQRELAKAVKATVRELRGDHLCPLVQPEEFSTLTVELVDLVSAAARAA